MGSKSISLKPFLRRYNCLIRITPKIRSPPRKRTIRNNMVRTSIHKSQILMTSRLIVIDKIYLYSFRKFEILTAPGYIVGKNKKYWIFQFIFHRCDGSLIVFERADTMPPTSSLQRDIVSTSNVKRNGSIPSLFYEIYKSLIWFGKRSPNRKYFLDIFCIFFEVLIGLKPAIEISMLGKLENYFSSFFLDIPLPISDTIPERYQLWMNIS